MKLGYSISTEVKKLFPYCGPAIRELRINFNFVETPSFQELNSTICGMW